jgi:hypothetical protein
MAMPEFPCVPGKGGYEYCGEAGECAPKRAEGEVLVSPSVFRRVIEMKQKRRNGVRVAKELKRRKEVKECVEPADEESRIRNLMGLQPGETALSVDEVKRWKEIKKELSELIARDERGEEGGLMASPEPAAPPPLKVTDFYNVLDDSRDSDCTNEKLKKQGEALVRFFSKELGLEGSKDLLGSIKCGGLRAAVRRCFPGAKTVLQELSLKTAQKVEKSCCKGCKPEFDRKMLHWRDKLLEDVDIDQDHLERYKKAFRANVPRKWNRFKSAYIPNGSATVNNSCALGGNWNREKFSAACRPVLVFSSGKPRIVTCYSSYNSQVLSPLHNSLYAHLSRFGWLLKGDPEPEHISFLNGEGKFLSFDYIGATDNIKNEYVKAGIEVLIEKADGLSEEEVRCLRVLGELKLFVPFREFSVLADGPLEGFKRGQAMGSLMSFPLLCLTNKTIVDMSITDLYESGSIGFEEWSSHRCKINGDDLLLREPRKDTDLASRIVFNGGQVGMETNMDKCLRSETQAEINSTIFENGEKKKKSNANALYMKPDVEDVLGLAYEATTTRDGFLKCVKANLGLLKKQEDKLVWKLPHLHQSWCRKDKKIRKALNFRPVGTRTPPKNVLPVVPEPDGYDLFPSEERVILEKFVEDKRDGVARSFQLEVAERFFLKEVNEEREELGLPPIRRPKKFTKVVKSERSWRSLVKKKNKKEKKNVLAVLADSFLQERAFLAGEDIPWSMYDVVDVLNGLGSTIEQMSAAIGSLATKKSAISLPTLNEDFISF